VSECPDLADYCEYLPDGSRQPCFAPAGLVPVRPSWQLLRFTCAHHLPAWASRIQGRYVVLERGVYERATRSHGLDVAERGIDYLRWVREEE
jgi:hypothetical protein